MKIAIFGGSFDPVHSGHEMVVKMTLQNRELDKLFIVPTFISPFKNNFSAPPQLRFAWLAKVFKASGYNGAIGEYTCDDKRLILSGWEMLQKQPVASIYTVRQFAARYPGAKIFFIIGADHLSSLQNWHEIESLKKEAEFVIASRNDITIPNEYKKLKIDCDISSSFIRNELALDMVNPIIKDEVKAFYKGKK